MLSDRETHGIKEKLASGPILMVDDNELDIYIARRYYEKSVLENDFLGLPSGQALIDYLGGVLSNEKALPALVLLDINMPDQDGFETLVKVREIPEFHDIPIVAMFTNSDDPEDIERSMELGADGFYTKPTGREHYVALFDSLARGET